MQLELFSGQNPQPGSSLRTANRSFYERIRNHEKTLLIIISVSLTAIISFSLGVEKGRRLALSNNNSGFDIGMRSREVLDNSPGKQEPVASFLPDTNVKNQPVQKKERQDKGIFAIQLASYKTKSYAEKEAIVLKKRGLNPIILTKGNYAVLYVGGFTNKETAQSIVTQLEKRYTGCRIRRL